MKQTKKLLSLLLVLVLALSLMTAAAFADEGGEQARRDCGSR